MTMTKTTRYTGMRGWINNFGFEFKFFFIQDFGFGISSYVLLVLVLALISYNNTVCEYRI